MLKRLRPLDMDGYYEGQDKWDDCNDEPAVKQPRTSNQFLLFCDLILKYEKYSPIKEEPNKSAYSSSSLERNRDSFSSESNSSCSSSPASGQEAQDEQDGDDDDSWDLITCPCMKPFAGRPMIECTVCQTWIHMSCAKIRRNNIPDDFVCQRCREARSSTRRSERIRSDDRRILST